MYTIKKCTEVLDAQIFKAFQDGFSDYIVQVKMDEDIFIKKFFKYDGNDRNLSIIAFRNHKPVGITLGGIKTTENFKTLRCGGMAVIPEERGSGLAKILMEHHQNIAIKNGCKQLFLEVIDANKRAINFYTKLGYEKAYNITYKKLKIEKHSPILADKSNHDIKVIPIKINDIIKMIKTSHSHLPWQSDYPYFSKLKCCYYGIKINNKIVAGIVANKIRVFFLWVDSLQRQKGCARALINKVILETKTKELNFSYVNNSLAHTFTNRYDMEKAPINQYEMYKWLG